MARKMIVLREDGSRPVLTETLAANEAQLQEIVKENPELLPLDEFGMSGPLLVVGRETTLRSGFIDLVGIARGGELILVEFKTGPQNSDFRHALAQLLHYGADLWQMSYDVFESTVARRYFATERCHDPRVRGKTSLSEAAAATWPDLSQEEHEQLRERLARQLETGAFHYVVAAQRFMETMERTIEYLNATSLAARFYAVEIVRFSADTLSAFESRTVRKPAPQGSNKMGTTVDEAALLQQIEDDTYRETLQGLFELCRGLGLHFEPGAVGGSIRLQTPDRAEPLSIAWVFPPGSSGWFGLRGLNFGFDPASAAKTPSVTPALEEYVSQLAAVPGIQRVKTPKLKAYYVDPDTAIRARARITEILAALVRRVGEA